eukprot:TRINITY_DN28552_c0_g1_i1.p2 TRINITY_DN28552_c0_g1~~TRINITY_DN28552_c0_g1_i1.p2  ORF type:complete len:120 (-),score=27.97 TRINITY_DN28552_c0_g1_i1:75-434(-)
MELTCLGLCSKKNRDASGFALESPSLPKATGDETTTCLGLAKKDPLEIGKGLASPFGKFTGDGRLVAITVREVAAARLLAVGLRMLVWSNVLGETDNVTGLWEVTTPGNVGLDAGFHLP